MQAVENGTDFTADNLTMGIVTTDGAPTIGSLDPHGERDWIAVTLEAGRAYRFDLLGVTSDAGTLSDPYLRLVDAQGNIFSENDDGGDGRESRILYESETSQTLYLSVGSYADTGAGTYKLTASELVDDYPDDISTTVELLPGAAAIQGGSQSSGDTDWFRLDVEEGQTYLIDLDTDGFVNAVISVIDAGGALVGFRFQGGEVQYSYSATQTGTVFVRAQTSGIANWEMSVTNPQDDFGNHPLTAGELLADGTPLQGEIEYVNDRDWFTLDLEAGQTYRIGLSYGDAESGTISFGRLRLYDGLGEQLLRSPRFASLQESDPAFERYIEFTAPETGQYHVSVAGFDDNPVALGTYTLAVTSQPDDYAATPLTSGALLVNGEAVSAQMDYDSDRDWFAVNLEGAARFELSGGQGHVAVYAGDMQLQTLENGVFAPDEPGTFYVEVTNASDSYEIRAVSTDLRTGTEQSDTLIARQGETVDGAGGDDRLMGIQGPNGLVGGDGNDLLLGFQGDDRLFGGGDNDTLNGGRGRDVLNGESGDDLLIGGWGKDAFHVGKGTDTVRDFRPGHDALHIRSDGMQAQELLDSAVFVAGGTFLAIETGEVFLEGVHPDDLSVGDFVIEPIQGIYDAEPVRPANLSDEMPEDLPAGLTTPRQLLPDGLPFSGAIGRPGDDDWFAVEMEEGQIYKIELSGLSRIFDDEENDVGTLEAGTIRIADSNGNIVSFSTDRDGRALATKYYQPETDGTFYLSVVGNDGRETGTYQLTFEGIEDAIGETPETAGALALDGVRVRSSIDIQGDRDLFSVELEAGQAYRFLAYGGTCESPILRLYRSSDPDSQGSAGGIASVQDLNGDDYARSDRMSFVAPEDGRYFIEIAGDEDDRDTGTYVIAAEPVFDDFADDASTEGKINVGNGGVRGYIETEDDEDAFTVDLQAGVTYRLQAQLPDGLATINDTYLDHAEFRLETSAGTLLAEATGTGPLRFQPPTILYTPTDDTSATVVVGAFRPVDGLDSGVRTENIGTYNITAEIFSDHIPGDATSGAVLLTDATPVSGFIETPDDIDWFGVSLIAGETYLFELDGDHFTGADLDLFDAGGVLLAEGVGFFDQSIQFTTTQTDDYFVSVGLRYTTLARNGYELVAELLLDDFESSVSSSGSIQVGQTLTGSVDFAGDEDWFEATLEAGIPYNIALNGSGLSDPLLLLRDQDGNVLAEDDDGGPGLNALLDFTPQTTGNYFVSALSALSTRTGEYELTLNAPDDDFSADGGTQGFMLADGMPTDGTLDYSGDTDWFRVDLVAGRSYLIETSAAATATIVGLAMGDEGLWSPAQSGAYFVSVSGTASDYQIALHTQDIFQGTDLDDDVRLRPWQQTFDGLAGHDRISGSSSDDLLLGSEGDDRLLGRGGNDVLLGGANGDRLSGGYGEDILAGEAGNDYLVGGAGRDEFVFSGGLDHIADFTIGEDMIRLTSVHSSLEWLSSAVEFAGGVLLAPGENPADEGIFLHGIETGQLSITDFFV